MAAHWFPRMTPAVRAYQCRFAAPRAIPYPLMASTCHGECEVLVSLRTTGGFHSRPGSKNQTASFRHSCPSRSFRIPAITGAHPGMLIVVAIGDSPLRRTCLPAILACARMRRLVWRGRRPVDAAAVMYRTLRPKPAAHEPGSGSLCFRDACNSCGSASHRN